MSLIEGQQTVTSVESVANKRTKTPAEARTKEGSSSVRVCRTTGGPEERLKSRRVRARARRASRTAEQRELGLQQRRDGVSSETTEQRDARLLVQQMSSHQHDRLSSETTEQREARLHQMSSRQRDRLSSETTEQREAKLCQMS